MEGSQIGPYRVLGDLGSGGMGKVYLAEVAGKVPGLDDGSRVALKVIHPHLLETPGFFRRFLREAEIGKIVEQDNVVRYFDCDALGVEGRRRVIGTRFGQALRDAEIANMVETHTEQDRRVPTCSERAAIKSLAAQRALFEHGYLEIRRGRLSTPIQAWRAVTDT